MDPSRLWGGLMWPLGFVRLVPHGGPGTWHCCEHHGHMQSLLNGWVGVKGSSLEIGYLYETLRVCEGSWPPCQDFSLLDFPHAFLLSHPTRTLCRPSPCPQHAPCHLRARGNSRLYPMPCGCRAAGHRGQVEQGWPPPAG